MGGNRGDLTPEQYEILFGALPPSEALAASEAASDDAPNTSKSRFTVSEGTALDVRPWWRQRRSVAPVVTAMLGLCALVVIAVSFWISDPSSDTTNNEVPEASAFVDDVANGNPSTTIVAEETSTSATATPTTALGSTTSPPTSAATAITSAASLGKLEVTRCDARREVVTIMNTGDEAVAMTGWILQNESRTHEADLSELSLDPGERVVLLSGERAEDPVDTVRWTDADVWDNDGDVATLLRNGESVSTLGC